MPTDLLNVPGIYKVENKINQKVYIGQSKTVKRRLNSHKIKTHNKHLQRSIDLYGIEHFTFEVLVTFPKGTDRSILNIAEVFWVKVYNATDPDYGYNIRQAGNGTHAAESIKKMSSSRLKEKNPMYGKKQSAETIAKRVAKIKGRKHSDEAKLKMKTAIKNRAPVTDETRKKMSQAHKGKKVSDETKKIIAEASRNRSPETRKKMSDSAKNRKKKVRNDRE